MVREDKLNNLAKYNNNNTNIDHIEVVSMDKEEPNSLRSVYRAANILTCISNGIDSITGIANACGLNKSTVYRLLKAMSEARLITRNPITRKYHIGPLITEISSDPNVAHEQLILCAINEMRALSSYSRESIGLDVLIGFQHIVIFEIPSTQDLRITGKSKVANDIHVGNSKVLLAQLDTKELNIIMKNIALDPITENTITSKKELLARIRQIKQQGYGIAYGERNEGAICISVPINNYLLPATISILGPDSRVRPRIDDYINKLQASSNRIQANIREVFNLI